MSDKRHTLIKGALVVATQDEQLGEIPGGEILVGDGLIEQVGTNLQAPGAEIIDATGCLVLPGLVNTHHHLFQVLTRALPRAQDAKLFDWLVFHYDVWRHISPADVQAAASAGLAELLLSGCCLSADHHYLIPAGAGREYFQAEAEAARRLGIRLHLTRGSMSLGRSSGGLPPDETVQDADTILADAEQVIAELHDPRPDSLCRVALAPCSPFSVTPELMRDTARLARSRQVRLHTHLAETLDEERFCRERFGRRPLDYAEDLGWLGPDVWFAHCVFLNADEIKRLAASGTGVAHCPASNLRLGSGIAPVPAMLEAGVPVGLAVDGSASNDSSNLLRELQLLLLVHRVGTAVESMPVRQALRVATSGGARVLGWENLGRLRPGAAADLALFKLDQLPYAGALLDPPAALLMCGLDQRAWLVMVNGRVVVREKHLVAADEQRLFEDAQAASQRLLRSAGIIS
ncbi:MAG: 8-oxoguanine deaminase [Deltaproteobacteria bacterium]|nr:MAG: 8-oxoguanine deaminase [Deltaproteobacteria bacterium]